MILSLVLGSPAEHMFRIQVDNAGLTAFVFRDRARMPYRCSFFTDVRPLQPEPCTHSPVQHGRPVSAGSGGNTGGAEVVVTDDAGRVVQLYAPHGAS